MKKYLLFLALGASVAMYSCEPEDPQPVNTTQNPGTTTDTIPKITYVTAKTWRITAFTQGAPGSTAHSDIYTTGIPNCQKDDTYRFTTPDVLTVGPGGNKCNPSGTDQAGTWNLNNNSTLMTLNNPSQNIAALNGEFMVVEITATRMMITRVLNGSQYTVTFMAL